MEDAGLNIIMHSLANGLPREDVPLPTINAIDDDLALQLVATKLGKHDGPNDPIRTTGDENAEADNHVDPVRQGLVYGAVGGRDPGGNDEVDVGEKEEDDNGEGRGEWRVPVPGLAVQVEVDETAGDEDVDDGERVGDDAGASVSNANI